MKKRNILMCLQQLDIGGVETAVVTLCKGYIRAGHNVYVAAKNGIFSSKLQELGVEILDMEYPLRQTFPLEEKEKLKEFVQKRNITEIHIHQYPCVLYWLPVCMELNIPYVAYVHSIVEGAPKWFMDSFLVYRFAFPLFFEYASKIVCIAEKSKNEIKNLFNIPEEKFKIIHNSLNMEDFPSKQASKRIKVFGIVARLAEEKELSIKTSIDFFKEYSKENKDCKLIIAGEGPSENHLKRYAKSNKIEFIGAISNIPEFMRNIDVFMGVDRCILEACASKCLSIISSYDGTLCLLNKSNIEKASQVNFSGTNLSATENLLETLMNIDEKKYSKLVEDNYKYINKNYNVDNNLYTDELTTNFSKEYLRVLPIMNEYLKEIKKLRKEVIKVNNKRLIVKIQNLYRRVINKIRRIIKMR